MNKENLIKKTYEELRKISSKKKIEGRSKMNKNELVKAILKNKKNNKKSGGTQINNNPSTHNMKSDNNRYKKLLFLLKRYDKEGKIEDLQEMMKLLPPLHTHVLPPLHTHGINYNNLKNKKSFSNLYSQLPPELKYHVVSYVPIEIYHIKIKNNEEISNLINSFKRKKREGRTILVKELRIEGFNINFQLLEELFTLITIKRLDWKNLSSFKVGFLPSSLEELSSRSLMQRLEVGTLPPSLKELSLFNFYLNLNIGVLPSSLEYLHLGEFNRPLNIGVLPSSLKKLSLYNFNQPLSIGVLPSSLEDLYLYNFNQPLSIGVLPPSLEKLSMSNYNKFLGGGILPSSLKKLTISKKLYSVFYLFKLKKFNYPNIEFNLKN